MIRISFILLIISGLSSVDGLSQSYNQVDDQGKRHGQWQKKYPQSQQLRYEGTFEHGKEIGDFKFYDEKGGHPTAIKSYTVGSPLLDVSFYTTAGKKVSEGKMLEKKREGEWIYYHQDGDEVMIKENYSDDLLSGKRTVYYITGEIASIENYEAGLKNGQAVNYSDKGKLLQEVTFKEDRLQGWAKIYDPTGVLIREGTYKDNKKHGSWKYYKDGVLEKTVKFPINKIGVQD